MQPSGTKLFHFNGEYQISGGCYYPDPSNPGTGYLRPFFIGIASDFKEKWILPFGVSDWLLGEAIGLLPLNDSTYMGYGYIYSGGDPNSAYMFFSDKGEELGYTQITNQQIGPDIIKNIPSSIARVNDSLFVASTIWGSESFGSPYGELMVDTAGNIYKIESRPNTSSGTTMIKTFNDKYVITCGYKVSTNNRDVYLYKINDSLQWDSVYTGNYTYDSLCPYTIESETIDVTNCLVFTDVKEIPTPDEYYANLNTVHILAYPNPATSGELRFTFQNTDQHRNMQLRCFNIFGQQVHKEMLYPHQGESLIDVHDWQSGIYMAVVYAEGMPVGRVKFIIQ